MPGTCFIFALLCSFVAMQSPNESSPPEWTRAPAEPNLFVVETEEFSTHLDVTNGLLPAVRAEVARRAQQEFGADCVAAIMAIPLADFRDLIYEDQEFVHQFKKVYDEETAKRLDAEYDMYYRGYIRVKINDVFRDRVQQTLSKIRLKNRLCGTFVCFLLVAGVAAIGWGYLYYNRISRGFYVSRLRWIAGALLTTLILVCYAISQQLL